MMSIVIPAYNEEENIEKAASVIGGLMDEHSIPCEIIFVDDGSRDSSWSIIDRLSRENSNIRGLKFSRNFGKEGAIFAGLEACLGDCAAVIDCDLQHPPEVLIEMYSLWQKGFQVVEAVKASRGKEGFVYKFFAKSFYRLMKSSANVSLDRASDFKLMDRQVVDELNALPERLTFFRALSSWVGFKTTQVEFNVAPRNAGTTKWSFSKLMKFALSNLTGFTNAPLQAVTVCAVLSYLAAAVMLIFALVKLCQGAPDGFWLLSGLILFVGAVIMTSIGIVGYYLAKIYEEIKHRPRYIVSIDTNDRKQKRKD